jgi:hypothetical protein
MDATIEYLLLRSLSLIEEDKIHRCDSVLLDWICLIDDRYDTALFYFFRWNSSTVVLPTTTPRRSARAEKKSHRSNRYAVV